MSLNDKFKDGDIHVAELGQNHIVTIGNGHVTIERYDENGKAIIIWLGLISENLAREILTILFDN